MTIAVFVGSSLGCYEARLDAITEGKVGGDAGGGGDIVKVVASGGGDRDGGGGGDGGNDGGRGPDTAASPQPVPTPTPTAACVPGADTEKEPNNDVATATPSSASVICGAVTDADVDFFRLVAGDAGAVTGVHVEIVSGDGGGIRPSFVVNGVVLSPGNGVQGTSGSTDFSAPTGTTGDPILRITTFAGTGTAAYVIRVHR